MATLRDAMKKTAPKKVATKKATTTTKRAAPKKVAEKKSGLMEAFEGALRPLMRTSHLYRLVLPGGMIVSGTCAMQYYRVTGSVITIYNISGFLVFRIDFANVVEVERSSYGVAVKLRDGEIMLVLTRRPRDWYEGDRRASEEDRFTYLVSQGYDVDDAVNESTVLVDDRGRVTGTIPRIPGIPVKSDLHLDPKKPKSKEPVVVNVGSRSGKKKAAPKAEPEPVLVDDEEDFSDLDDVDL